MICSGCLKDVNKEGYCTRCRKKIFKGKNVSSILPFNSPYKETSDLFLNHTKKISISGVQIKYSLRLNGNQLELTDQGGEYILKPIPTGQLRHLDQAPANEHITMQIAQQIFNINVPANAIIFFEDRSPAYIVKRFDLNADGTKLQQEDFAQIAQMTSETHGINFKYDLSYEEIGNLIKKYIPTYRIEIEKFFRLVLFNYVFSNGDAHIKNFSAIQSTQGDYVLSPGYDLLCTRIHSPQESDMALTLFKDDFSEAYQAYGFYTYQDFLLFGQKLGIKTSRVEKVISEFSVVKDKVQDLVNSSFLAENIREEYQINYLDKVKRLNMGRS